MYVGKKTGTDRRERKEENEEVNYLENDRRKNRINSALLRLSQQLY